MYLGKTLITIKTTHMKSIILLVAVLLTFTAKADPPRIVSVTKLSERLPGIAFDYYYDVVAMDSIDNTYRYLLPPTFKGISGDTISEKSGIEVVVNGNVYVNYLREYFFKIENRRKL